MSVWRMSVWHMAYGIRHTGISDVHTLTSLTITFFYSPSRTLFLSFYYDIPMSVWHMAYGILASAMFILRLEALAKSTDAAELNAVSFATGESYTLCPMSYVIFPMSYVRCPMS
jgi:hypothetical protein